MIYAWLRDGDRRLPILSRGIDDLALLPATSIAAYLAETRMWFSESDIRYLVSHFDADHPDELVLIPQRTDAVWRTLDATLEQTCPVVAAQMLPVFWQMGPMFFKTCRARGVPVSVLTPRNIPLAKQLIAEVQAELVVTTPDVANDLAEALHSDGLLDKIKAWHLVAPIDGPIRVPVLPGKVNVERHLIPGIPIMSSSDSKSYSLDPDLLGEIQGDRLLVTSLVRHARPFLRLELPLKISASDDGCLRYVED